MSMLCGTFVERHSSSFQIMLLLSDSLAKNMGNWSAVCRRASSGHRRDDTTRFFIRHSDGTSSFVAGDESEYDFAKASALGLVPFALCCGSRQSGQANGAVR